MVKASVYLLAVLEIVAGLAALAATLALLLIPSVGMVMLWFPHILVWTPLAVAGALLFTRRRWAYWVNLAALIGGGLACTWVWMTYFPAQASPIMLAWIVPVAAAVIFFLLPPVRGFFGLGQRRSPSDPESD